ncbi:unnamed protein product [Chilo suppressalis]|uniref:Regulatory protein zeste n=1 Tax=Chilo suppressalis TaxID=168631 RepID=A0ABN8B8G2_CHISP|nr:unnamed protein product [Chilo suppressalis]
MESGSRISRPTLNQVKAVVEYMQKHPDLAKKHRYGVSPKKFKKLWLELTKIANSIDGTKKSTEGWIKFWSDKRRSIIVKKKQIEEGKIQGKLLPMEQKILDLCEGTTCSRRKSEVKEEPSNGADDDSYINNCDDSSDNFISNETIGKQINILANLVDVMGQQSSAMLQVAKAQLDHSKSLERFAEASYLQALAVDRIADTFENISSSVHEVGNALLGIGYTMNRGYPPAAPQIRQNSNIFS